MNFNLKQLQAFVWVADLGSFRKAADRLNTTQPNISSRIASLESVLDVSLMERDAGSVRLTSKGQMLLEQARKVLAATDHFIEAANQDALMNGQLRLGVTEMVVHTWLRDFLRVLKDRYPNITVELTVDLSANLEKELFERSIDLAFQSGPFKRETTGSKDLGVFPLIWIASPETGLHSRKQVSMEDLVHYPILTHARGTQPYQEVAAHFASRRDLAARLVPSSNLAACIHMTIDGFGTATVPAAMVLNELQNGELVQVNYGWTPKSLSFSARYDAEKSAQFVLRAAEISSEISLRFALEFAAKNRIVTVG
ncbi:MAG: LysR family transcriptional regulator [Gammaproteobacteria bacterium]|nr:LysR family transcriptional regulator [Gammaproteobacteria bacterium]